MRSFLPHVTAACLLGLGTIAGIAPAGADAATRYTDLGPGFAASVNDHALAVGLSDVGGVFKPATWDRAGHRTLLPKLPDSTDEPYPGAVNDRGEVIGNTYTSDGRNHALRWNRAGDLTDLQFPPGTTFLYPRGINDAGVVIGSAGGLVVRWDRQGRVHELPVPPGSTSAWATAINTHGTVVGNSLDETGHARPLLWDPTGALHLLPVPAGLSEATVQDVNDHGTAVGRAYGNSGAHAVRWDGTTGHTTVLPDLPGETSHAQQVNERGTILGFSFLPGRASAVRWIDDRVLRLAGPAGSSGTTATQENDHDIVIGRADLNGQSRPVWWDRNGTARWLPCPAGSLSCQASALADPAIAVGSVTISDTSPQGAEEHAVRWRLDH